MDHFRKNNMRKRFGQHFLTDNTVIHRIIEAFAPVNGQRIIEIGAGRGALTDVLIAHLNNTRITVIELDRNLASYLKQRYQKKSVNILAMDILDLNLCTLPEQTNINITGTNDIRPSDHNLRLLGNLPYNISTPLIFHLIKQLDTIQDMLFMVQKEVALRLAAKPGNKTYGRLSVMTRKALDCDMLFDVMPDAFCPPPKVISTVIRLTKKKSSLKPANLKIFNDVVNAAFSQRRKKLPNALANLAQPKHFEHANINVAERAENLSVEQYIALADAINCMPN